MNLKLEDISDYLIQSKRATATGLSALLPEKLSHGREFTSRSSNLNQDQTVLV